MALGAALVGALAWAAPALADDPAGPPASPTGLFAPDAPSRPPSISGTPKVGLQLTANPGNWESGVTIADEWLRCHSDGGCVKTGVTTATYDLGAADAGMTIKLRETGTRPGGPLLGGTREVDGSPTAAVVSPPVPPAGGIPAPSGTARDRETLTASDGVWTGLGGPFTFTRKWQRCATTCADIPAATGPTYTLTQDDVGKAIRVEVTATGTYGQATSASARTAEVSAIVAAAPTGGGGGGTGDGGTGTTKPKTPRLKPFPVVVIAGRVSGSITLITRLSVRAPRGSRVTIRCRGRCAFGRARPRTLRGRTLRLASAQGFFGTGATLEIRVTKKGYIGKYTRFRFRTGLAPARIDRCLKPGRTAPTRCAS